MCDNFIGAPNVNYQYTNIVDFKIRSKQFLIYQTMVGVNSFDSTAMLNMVS
jgi:hypothetical protein